MPKRRQLSAWFALLFFLLLTLFMTYPLSRQLDRQVRDYGDSLLNTWILATVANKLARLEFNHFFAANIFYPEEKPLLYSELLIPQALLAIPLLKITRNPVLTHNIILLIALLTSALSMFFLARFLCQSFWPSVVAGVIFAFSPFMMAHTVQLQVVSAGGLPLLFLFLHRYFRRGHFADWVVFSVIYIVQSLANLYYALFLIIFSGLFILSSALVEKTYGQKKFWLHILVFILAVSLCLGPIFLAYSKQQKRPGFERTIGAEAKLSSFLATGRIDRLYGRFLAQFRQPEGELFPGFIPLALALTGFILTFINRKNKGPGVVQGQRSEAEGRRHPPQAEAGNQVEEKMDRESAGGGKESFSGSERLEPKKVVLIYSLIFGLAVWFCFGSKGPFWLLYRFVPGYKAIRAVPRFYVFALLSLALFSAIGLTYLRAKIKSQSLQIALTIIFLTLIVIEYISIPLPTRPVVLRSNLPPVYQELAKWQEKKVLLELPLPEPGTGIGRVEAPRMYYSLFHGHRLVNGYSGFFSPTYVEVRESLHQKPLEENILFWKRLGINLIIIHAEELKTENYSNLIEVLKNSSYLHFSGQFLADFLFAIN